jgi:hypothetical protein
MVETRTCKRRRHYGNICWVAYVTPWKECNKWRCAILLAPGLKALRNEPLATGVWNFGREGRHVIENMVKMRIFKIKYSHSRHVFNYGTILFQTDLTSTEYLLKLWITEVKQKVVMMLVDVRGRTCNGIGEYVEIKEIRAAGK